MVFSNFRIKENLKLEKIYLDKKKLPTVFTIGNLVFKFY